MTLDAYLSDWLNTYVAPLRAPSTYACYARSIRHIPDDLMATPVTSVSAMSIQRAVNCLAIQYPRAAQLLLVTLRAAYNQAVRLDIVDRSPCRACIMPHHESHETTPYNAAQLARYLLAARDVQSYPLLLLIACCGLRRGEALGLTFDCVTPDGLLSVHQQRYRHAGLYALRLLKSRASRRLIPLPPALIDALSMHRLLSARSTDYVSDITPERLQRDHIAVIQAAGLPHIPLHGLRRTMASLAADAGAPIATVQSLLGHAHMTTTADYYVRAYASSRSSIISHIVSAALPAPVDAHLIDQTPS